MRFAATAQIHAERGDPAPRPIVGAELLLDDGDRLVLLVRDLAGYRNLCWLIDRAHRRGPAPPPIRAERGRTAPPLHAGEGSG